MLRRGTRAVFILTIAFATVRPVFSQVPTQVPQSAIPENQIHVRDIDLSRVDGRKLDADKIKKLEEKLDLSDEDIEKFVERLNNMNPSEVPLYVDLLRQAINASDITNRQSDPVAVAARLKDLITKELNDGLQTAKGKELARRLDAERARIEQCHPAAIALVSLRSRLSGGRFNASEADKIPEPGEVLPVVQEYISKCLTPPGQLDSKLRQRLDSYIGVMTVEGRDPSVQCSVTRVGQTSVLTAKHCLYGYDDDDKSYSLVPNSLRHIRFASTPDARFEITGITPTTAEDGFDANQDVDDWVTLTITDPGDHFVAPAHGVAARFDGLIVYGYQPLVEYRDRLLQRLRDQNPDLPRGTDTMGWQSKLMADNLPTCSVALVASSNACLLHGCQTEGGISGAGLFTPTATLVGVHTRSIELHDSRPCTKDAPAAIPNCGLSLPATAFVNSADGATTRISER
jgi:hypothetical protein